MNTTITQDKPGRGASPVAREMARLRLSQELRKRYDLATELLALGQLTVEEAIQLVQSRTAEEHIARSQDKEREKRLQLLLLTKIEGIDMPLAEDLIDEFGSLEAIAKATPDKLENVPGIDKNKAEAIVKEVAKLINEL